MARKSRISWKEHLTELLVVIIGITIAFSIENYAAKRKERKEELLHLKGIADDLKTDLASFDEYLGYEQTTLRYVRRLNEILRARDSKNDSLNYLLLRAGWISSRGPRDISYQSLRSSGALDKITNFELRRKIVYHYEQKMSKVLFINETHSKNLDEYVTPLQIEYTDFTYYQGVDVEFFNSRGNLNVFSGLEGLLVNKVEEYERVVGFTRELLTEVQDEINGF